MSLKSKIEAVVYASEEPVTLQQLVGLLGGEAQEELDSIAALQVSLPLQEETAESSARSLLEAGTDDQHQAPDGESAVEHALSQGEVTSVFGGTAESGPEEPASVPSAEHPPVPPPDQQDDAPGGLAPQQESPAEEASATEAAAPQPDPEKEKRMARERERAVREHIRGTVDQLIREYAESDRGIEIREVASGFRMGTKPEYHDAVRGFVKSLKPALKLTLPALETLAVVAYKQPVTAAEISEIRGVDSAGVLGGLMSRKLIATAGRKQVIGRPMLYKTTRDFLLRFGLKDIQELPSMEEFERMSRELAEQEDLPMEGAEGIIEQANARGDAEMIRDANAGNTAGNDSSHAEQDGTTASETNNHQQQATAEIAAGGNSEADQVSQPAEQQPSEEVSTAE